MRATTEILVNLGRGDAAAEPELLAAVYQELRRLARRYLREDRDVHTLEPTALVHEAYLRLIDSTALASGDRERFFALAARAMRHILVDHARRRKAAKRGGVLQRVPLNENVPDKTTLDVLDVNELVDLLATADPRAGRVVELRFFAGLSVEETARALGVSSRTVDNDWYVARIWLAREIGRLRDR